ncbi:MAG: acyl carrier protein [Leptospirales bacterium]|nr:acyl carrier protein [Leptospirales bacterium]
MSDVKSKVKQIIANHLELEADMLSDDATFKDFGADSIEIVELIIAFEVEFGIEIPESDAEKLHSIKDIYTYIENIVIK